MDNNCPELGNINSVILHSEGSSSVNQIIPQQAKSDEQVIAMWLHGRSMHTQKAYLKDVCKMRMLLNKPLQAITLGDLQYFIDQLESEGLQSSSRHRVIAAIKSLFSFAQKIGYLHFNPAKVLLLPKYRDTLNERILTEAEVQRIIGMENHPRNRLVLRMLYAGGLRVSELCRMQWTDLQVRENGGQLTYMGKRNKTNTIIIPEPLWSDLMTFRNNKPDSDYVFKSRKGGELTSVQVWRIVKGCIKKAGIQKMVSPHWFRHAHASHSLDRGAKISLVKETLNHASIQTTGKYLHARPGECSSTYLKV